MRLLCLLFTVCTALAAVHASSSTAKLQLATLNAAIQAYLSDVDAPNKAPDSLEFSGLSRKSYLSQVAKLRKLPYDTSKFSEWFKCERLSGTIFCTLNQMPSLAEYESIVATATSQGDSLLSNISLYWALIDEDGIRHFYDADKYNSIPKPSDPIVRKPAEGNSQRLHLEYKVNVGVIRRVKFDFGK